MRTRILPLVALLLSACATGDMTARRTDSLRWSYDLVMNRAYEQARFGEYGEVLAMANAGILIDSMDFEAHYYAAFAHHKLGNHDLARQALERVRQRAPATRDEEVAALRAAIEGRPGGRRVRRADLSGLTLRPQPVRVQPPTPAPLRQPVPQAAPPSTPSQAYHGYEGVFIGFFDGDPNAVLEVRSTEATLLLTSRDSLRTWHERLHAHVDEAGNLRLDGVSARLVRGTGRTYSLDHFSLRFDAEGNLVGTNVDDRGRRGDVVFRRR